MSATRGVGIGGHLGVVLAAALALTAALLAARLVPETARVELGAARSVVLAPRLERALAGAEPELVLVWFGTPADALPAGWRPVRAAVLDLFAQCERAAPGRVRTLVLEPARDPEALRYAARLGVRPTAARVVRGDAWSETEVWSTLRIADGARGVALVQALGPELAASLQELVAAELEALAAPRRPRIAIEAPESFLKLRTELGRTASVADCAFERSAELPADADVLVWIEPREARPEHVRALEAFLARGGSVLVAGSEHAARIEVQDGRRVLASRPRGTALQTLLPHFGLAPAGGVLLERRGAPAAPGADDPDGAIALRVASIGEHQDFRALGAEPGGTVFFESACALVPDAPRLAESGWRFQALCCSGAASFLADVPAGGGAVGLPAAAGASGRAGAHVLAARLEPVDPWRGRLWVLGSASAFTDAELADERTAHVGLVAAARADLAARERLARRTVAHAPGAPLREFTARERGSARFLVAVLPALLAALVAARHLARGVRSSVPWRRLALPTLAAVVGLAASAALGRGAGLDLTRERRHALPAGLRSLARAAEEQGASVRLTCVFSPHAELPPELRGPADDVMGRVAAIARLSGAIEHRVVRPASDAELYHLVPAFPPVPRARVTSTLDERTETRSVLASVVLECGPRTQRVDFASPRDFEELDLRLGAALWRATTGERRTVAFAGGEERLSPAEARLEFERRGRFAPRPGARFELARAALVRAGFDVVDVDPAAPVLPARCDALVWLAPRRDVQALGVELARHLAGGGRAFVALQPWRLRPVRRLGHAGALALWPEPQYPDLDEQWLPRLGVGLARTILSDARSGTLALDTKHEADGAGADRALLVRESVSAPVIVRAAPADGAGDLLHAGALPELVLPLPARFELDRVELARRGLVAHTLYATSAAAWESPWHGGDLGPDALAAPPDAAGTDAARAAPVALLVRGTFPGPAIEPAWRSAAPRGDPAGAPRAGELVLCGNAEAFANDALAADAAAERFLVQSLAALCLPADVAGLGGRAPAAPGLEPLAGSTRAALRALVVLGVPLAMLLIGVLVIAARRRGGAPARTPALAKGAVST